MSESPPYRLRFLPRWAWAILGLGVAYLIAAYFVIPRFDSAVAVRHAIRADNPRLTRTASGLPGDPLNVVVVGSEEEVLRAMLAAGWDPADPLTFHSSLRIAIDTALRKPDGRAPVSNLYLFERKEDLAFEKQVGDSPRRRHHVRFWRKRNLDEGRSVWLGAAAFDTGIEFSRTTGEITHHISPDVDAERDLLLTDLGGANCLATTHWLADFHVARQGRNGGGDPWHTDGRLAIGVLKPTPLAIPSPLP